MDDFIFARFKNGWQVNEDNGPEGWRNLKWYEWIYLCFLLIRNKINKINKINTKGD